MSSDFVMEEDDDICDDSSAVHDVLFSMASGLAALGFKGPMGEELENDHLQKLAARGLKPIKKYMGELESELKALGKASDTLPERRAQAAKAIGLIGQAWVKTNECMRKID